MTNATKSLAGIFIVLLALTAAIKWSSGPEASDAFRSTLVNVDTSRVDKLVIQNPSESSLILNKDNQKWYVSGEAQESYPADASRITRAINRLNNLNVNTVATRNPEKFTRYKVDSTGTKVSLYKEDKLLESIFIGAPQRAGRRSLNNYVRLADEDIVYTVEGFLGATFASGVDSWRDKRVWDVERANITRVDFVYPADSSFTIQKTETQKWISENDTLSDSSVSSVLSRLDQLHVSGFADSLSVDAFGSEKYVLQLALSEGEQHRLRLKETPSDSTVYLGVTPDYPYVFTLRKTTWDDYVLKSRDELLQKSNE